MKIRYLFGPKLHTIEHVNRDVAQPLITAGLAEELQTENTQFNPITRQHEPEDLPVCGESHQDAQRRRLLATMKKAPHQSLQPTWSVSIENYLPDQKALAVRMAIGNQVTLYFGYPDRINDAHEWPGGSRYLNGFGRAVPDEIVKKFKREWKANKQLRLSDAILKPNRQCLENETLADTKKAFDREMAQGSVPYFPTK